MLQTEEAGIDANSTYLVTLGAQAVLFDAPPIAEVVEAPAPDTAPPAPCAEAHWTPAPSESHTRKTATREALRFQEVARETLLAALDQGWADPRRLHKQARDARLLLDNAREVARANLHRAGVGEGGGCALGDDQKTCRHRGRAMARCE